MLIGPAISVCSTFRSGADPNLLASLSWAPDANTTLSIANGRARATLFQNSNPRIWKGSVSLAAGTYRYAGNIYALGLGWRFRISTNSGIPDGNVVEVISSDNATLNDTFVLGAPANVYLGVVAITSVVSDFMEIDDNFSLTRVS